MVERHRLHLRRDLRAEAAVLHGLMCDHQAVGLLNRAHDRLEVERHERARVDHLGLDALGGQSLSRAHRLGHEPRQRDDGHVAALA